MRVGLTLAFACLEKGPREAFTRLCIAFESAFLLEFNPGRGHRVHGAPSWVVRSRARTVVGGIGLEMSWTEIQSTMERHGIRRVDPKGEKFDYNLHQAMFEVPSDAHEPGTVVEVVQHGYVLHDRLLRPAMVGVAKAADTEASESGDSE